MAAVGFTRPIFTEVTPISGGSTLNLSDYASVQAGLNAVANLGNGSTLLFDVADTVHNITATLSLNGKDNFKVDMNGCTIRRGAAGTYQALHLEGCNQFRFTGGTIDGGTSAYSGGATHLVQIDYCGSLDAPSTTPDFTFDDMIFMRGHTPDCLVFRGRGSFELDTDFFSQNGLIYKCQINSGSRLGATINNATNIQFHGVSFADNGDAAHNPNGCFDSEPNAHDFNDGQGLQQSTANHIYFVGCTFARSANAHVGFVATTSNWTIEGCYFTGGSSLAGLTTVQVTGTAIRFGLTNQAIIRFNTFENFDTNYSAKGFTSVISMGGNVTSNIDIYDNVFANITANVPMIRLNSDTNGSVTGNKGYGVTGNMTAGAAAGSCVVSNNTKTSLPAVYPTPLPPWDVTFGDDGGPVFPDDSVEYDAVSDPVAEFTTTTSWTHTPVGTPKGVVVLITQRANAGADQVSGVTYDGDAMTRVAFAQDLTTETGAAYAYHLGTGISTGAVTVEITLTGAGACRAHCITLTADGDTEVDTFGVAQNDQANPTITLATSSGVTCFVAGCLFSGHNAAASVTPGDDFTEVAEYNIANLRTFSFMKRTANSTGGDVTVDWVATTENAAAVALAVKSVVTVPVVNILVQPTGLSRTRALGSINVTITDPPLVLVTPLGMERTRALGTPSTDIVQEATVAVGYTELSDEEMSIVLVGNTSGPIEPHVVRDCLLTIRDRPGRGELPTSDGTFSALSDEEMEIKFHDNTNGTVDSYVLRSAILSINFVNSPPLQALDGSYRLLSTEEMNALVYDSTFGYVDAYILRSAILTLRDWSNA